MNDVNKFANISSKLRV